MKQKEIIKDYQIFIDTLKNNIDNIQEQLKLKLFLFNRFFVLNLLNTFFMNIINMVNSLINDLYFKDHILNEKISIINNNREQINHLTKILKGYEQSFLYIEHILKEIQPDESDSKKYNIYNDLNYKLSNYSNMFRHKYEDKDFIQEGAFDIVKEGNEYSVIKKKHLKLLSKKNDFTLNSEKSDIDKIDN